LGYPITSETEYPGARMSGIEPSRWLRIIQTGVFLRKWSTLGLDDDDLFALEVEILKGP
jgi:hypothetical protein